MRRTNQRASSTILFYLTPFWVELCSPRPDGRVLFLGPVDQHGEQGPEKLLREGPTGGRGSRLLGQEGGDRSHEEFDVVARVVDHPGEGGDEVCGDRPPLTHQVLDQERAASHSVLGSRHAVVLREAKRVQSEALFLDRYF